MPFTWQEETTTRLARTPELVRLMVRAVREGFQVIRVLGIPVTPQKLRFLELLPEGVLVTILRLWANTKHFETVATHHSNAARDRLRLMREEKKLSQGDIELKL
jgi:hypothetical protein